MSELNLRSTVTCPECGHAHEEIMPTDACQWFYECTGCHAVLRPLPGDCCVFCSYGTVKCPPVQDGQGGCCSGGDASVNAKSEAKAVGCCGSEDVEPLTAEQHKAIAAAEPAKRGPVLDSLL